MGIGESINGIILLLLWEVSFPFFRKKKKFKEGAKSALGVMQGLEESTEGQMAPFTFIYSLHN